MICKLISSSCLAVLVVVIWRVLNAIWFRPKRLEKFLRKQGFRGNSYRLFYGDMKKTLEVINEANSKPINLTDDHVPRVLPSAYRTYFEYGKNSFTWIGQIPRVYITDPKLAKEVISKFDTFHKHFKTPNPLLRLFISGVITYEGDKWTKHRGILNPAFQLEKLKSMLPAFQMAASEMVSKWEKLMSAEGSVEVNIWPYLEALTAEAISRTAFGHSYEEGRQVFVLLKEQAELSFELMQSVYISGWRFMPTKSHRRMKQVDREVQASIISMIQERVKAMKAGQNPDDMLTVLLKSNFKQIEQGIDYGMTVQDVITECKLFYFAGQETSSSLLAWTMILLSRYPTWQTRAREEVLKVFGNRKPDYEGISRLKIVTMIFNEVLRLYPPVVELTRKVGKETKLGDMTLPEGVQLMILTVLLHHDKEAWGEDAKEFNPERFSEGISKATKNQFSYFPFGWGPRICIGQNFALLEVKVVLSMILQNFSFELSLSYTHAPAVIITLHPQYGAHLVLHKLVQN